MSDWKKRNEDWRDEDELEEEEECECPWVDSKGKVRETAYCQYLLEKHPMMCLKQKLFDQNGEVDEDALLYEVHSDLRDFVLDNLAKKEKQVLDALRIETYTPEWKPDVYKRQELRTAQQNVEAFFRKEERNHAVPQQEVKGTTL